MTERMRGWILVGGVVLLAILTMACIKVGRPEPVITPVASTPTPLPPTPTPLPPTPTVAAGAEPAIVDVRLCRGLTEDERPFGETNTFSDLDPFVVSIQVKDFQPRNIVSAHWKQGEAVIGLTERHNVSGDAYVGLMLEPETRWVPGDYSLSVSIDGEVQETRDFSVIGMAVLPVPQQGGGGKSGGGGTTGDWQLYREDSLGFSIEYPADWLVDEGGSTVEFSHPQDVATALVLVNDDPAADAEGEANLIFEVLEANLSGVQLISSEPQDDGWHGIFFVYNDDGGQISGALLSKVAGSRGYNTVFLALQKEWDRIVPTLEQMWISFQIKGSTAGATTDEVSIVGLVRDGDTGRGIANATFVILKEGVTVQRFLDSGNDESLIYDSMRSGADGNIQGSVPVRQGATYAVFAVAKGYIPVVDTMVVSLDAADPWQITVTMQKE